MAVLFIVGLPRLPYRVWGLGVGFRIYKGLGAKHVVQTQIITIGSNDFYAEILGPTAHPNDIQATASVIGGVLHKISTQGPWEHIAAQGKVHVHLAMPYFRANRSESLDDFKKCVVDYLIILQGKVAPPLIVTMNDYPLFNYDKSDGDQLARDNVV